MGLGVLYFGGLKRLSRVFGLGKGICICLTAKPKRLLREKEPFEC